MSDYSQITFFTPKDGLATGNPNKIIYGSDVDAELSAISTAIASKADVDGDAIGAGTPATEINVDNLKLDANKIISTNTDGDIELEPNGAGYVVITNVDVAAGEIDGTVIGANSAAAGTFTTLNATTVDSTNLEVTNLKAKDGTTAGSIADVTGVVTLASSVLTTADINGGTVDGAVIGGATPAAITGTTLKANTSLELATGATVTAILDEDTLVSDSATALATQQSIKAYVDAQVTAQDLDVTTDSGTIAIDLDSETLTVAGGTGLDTSATGNTVTVAIDSTVATLTGTQTLTNKTLTSPDINTPDIDGGTIDGATIATSDVTVGAGKTLDVSAGTLTLANDQISGDKIEGGTIGSVTITTADINGGTLDGVTIGGSSAGAGSFTTLTASGDVNFDSGTFFVDASADAVGIGTSSPSALLHATPSGAFSTTYNNFAGDALFIDSSNATSGAGNFGGAITWSRMTGPSGRKAAIASFQDAADVDQNGLAFFVSNSAGLGDPLVEAMRIDSSGNVGIGCTPSVNLEVEASSNATFRVKNTTDSTATLQLTNTGSSNGTITQNSGNMAFSIGASEAMRIDSSGNLLVGTTDDTPSNNSAGTSADNGIALKGATGKIEVTRYDGVPFDANRTSTDGTIALFRKDGTTVGSIGVDSNNLYIANTYSATKSGLRLGGNITPMEGGLDSDGETDLGSGTYRWKDLYLSGGVYLGGTGSANQLDDYEEGTWTPTVAGSGGASTATYTAQTGEYTKIGNIVIMSFRIVLSAEGTASGNARVSGFPFNGTTYTAYIRADDTQSSNVDFGPRGIYSGVTGYVITLDAKTAAATGYTEQTYSAFFANTTGILGTIIVHI